MAFGAGALVYSATNWGLNFYGASGPVNETVTQALAPAVSPQLVANLDTVAASYNLPDFVFEGPLLGEPSQGKD
ncbi:MAG: hypothetical protein WAT36_01965 [Chromatiaceae bacterium]